MIHLSKNLKRFGILLTAYTIVFRVTLSTVLSMEEYRLVWPVATMYAVAIAVTGWKLGSTDSVRTSRIHLGYYYHLETYAICNGIMIAWRLLGLPHHDTRLTIVLTLSIWGMYLLGHYLYSRHTIKGMRPEHIFK